MSVMVTIVLLKEACTYTSPWGTCLRSFFLKVFFLPFLSGVAAAPPAAAGFAIESVSSGQWPMISSWSVVLPATDHQPLRMLVKFSPSPSSSARPYPCADPSACGRWYAYAVRGPANPGDGGTRDKIRFR